MLSCLLYADLMSRVIHVVAYIKYISTQLQSICWMFQVTSAQDVKGIKSLQGILWKFPLWLICSLKVTHILIVF